MPGNNFLIAANAALILPAATMWLQYAALVEGFDITGVAICATVPAVLREIRKLIDEHYSDIKTTIIGPSDSYNVNAASELTIRSAPISFGLSTSSA